MGLDASLSIATSGLAAVQAEMAVASQNVANANVAGYAEETSSVSSRTAGGVPGGVLVGLTGRTINAALESSLYSQNAAVSALTTTNNALAPISALQGSTSSDSGTSNTLSDTLGDLQTALISLDADSSSTGDQQAVLAAAGTLVTNINTTATAYQTQRQVAQEAIVDGVATANTSLNQIGALSNQIAQAQINGFSTADLENQRSAVMTTLSSILSVNFTETSNGDMLVKTATGVTLPTHATSGPLVTSDATLGVTSYAPPGGSIPAITIGGTDVTSGLTGGSLGANIALRDQILPTMQAELDSFSQTLATRFQAQGLTLFTDASGNLPGTSTTSASPAGQLGFANVIQVNTLVTADPNLVRDGTNDVTDSGTGLATDTGATSFTINPDPTLDPSTTRGAADTTLIDRLLNYALGTQIQSGTTQPAATSTGLGASGLLSAPYSGSTDLLSLSSTLTTAQASTINLASNSLVNETAVQTSLAGKVAAVSGVSVDDEMSSIVALQNAYAANAKIVTAVETMFTALLAALT